MFGREKNKIVICICICICKIMLGGLFEEVVWLSIWLSIFDIKVYLFFYVKYIFIVFKILDK